MYLFFLHLTQQPDITLPLTFKTPSIKEKLAIEELSVQVN